jgi:hypothetical protein
MTRSTTSRVGDSHQGGLPKRLSWKAVLRWLAVSNLVVALIVFFQNEESWSPAHKVENVDNDPQAQAVAKGDQARHASYGFFDDISDAEWTNFHQVRARAYKPYRNLDDPNDMSHNVPFWTFYNLDPYFQCPRQRKIGGKWICDPDRLLSSSADKIASSACLIYSISASGNDWLQHGGDSFFGDQCEIHAFGHGSGIAADGGSKVVHHNVATDDPSQQVSLSEARKFLRHQNRTIDILALDCSGCEWFQFRDILKHSQFLRQILVRTHDLPWRNGTKATKFGLLPQLAVTEFFDSFHSHQFALFAKEVDSGSEECLETDWSFVRLGGEFFDQ